MALDIQQKTNKDEPMKECTPLTMVQASPVGNNDMFLGFNKARFSSVWNATKGKAHRRAPKRSTGDEDRILDESENSA